jgi:prophage regulatory protein
MDKDTSPDRIVRIDAVLDRTGLSRSTIYRIIQQGTFPKSVKLNGHARGWPESELNRWIASPPTYRR